MSSAPPTDAILPSSAPSPEAGQARRGIARAAGLIGLGNVTSRVLGLVRQSVIAALFGTGPLTSAFIIAAQVPTMVYDLLIGGLLSSALVPLFSEYATRDDDNESLWRLASLIMTLVGMLLAGGTLLVLLFAPLITRLMAGGFSPELQAATTLLIRLVSPALFFFGLSGSLTGLLYALKRFTFVAFSTAIFNLGIIVGALLLSRAFEGNARILGLALGLFLGSVLQFALLVPDLRDVRLRPRLGAFWRDEGLQRTGRLYLPVALSLVVSSVQITLDRNLATSTGVASTVAWMDNATKLIQFPLGLVGAAISLAVLPHLSRLAALAEWDGYRETLQLGLRLVLVLIIPATIGLFVLGEPVVRLLYERGAFLASDTYWTTLALRLYLLGMTFAAVDQLLIIAFYSRQDTWTPALVGVGAIGVYLLVALPLVGSLKMVGLVLANSAQHVSHALIMLWLLRRRLGGLGGGMARMVPRTLLAALGMGGAVWLARLGSQALQPGLVGQLLAVALPALVGIATYAALVTLLRVEDAQHIARILLRRRSG